MKGILAGIDSERAFRKPISGSHNIYELELHVYCWRNFVAQHLLGHEDFKIEINSITDWPTQYEATDENWKAALQLLEKSQDEHVQAFSEFDEILLDRSMHGRKFSWYDLLHVIVNHDIYHSAQTAI